MVVFRNNLNDHQAKETHIFITSDAINRAVSLMESFKIYQNKKLIIKTYLQFANGQQITEKKYENT